jgi:hypothetical protein
MNRTLEMKTLLGQKKISIMPTLIDIKKVICGLLQIYKHVMLKEWNIIKLKFEFVYYDLINKK